MATAVGLGVTTITATLGSVVGSDPLRVKTLSSLSVSPTVTSICPNASIQFYAQGTFSDGTTQYLTSSVTWTSSNTSVATIAINYVNLSASATGVSPGTVTITRASGIDHVERNAQRENAELCDRSAPPIPAFSWAAHSSFMRPRISATAPPRV